MLSGTSTLVGTENGFRIYIPTHVSHDSAFPFSDGQELVIQIDEDHDRLIIESKVDK